MDISIAGAVVLGAWALGAGALGAKWDKTN